ncbi:MAG: transporter substrate-binding domain-containing protein [Pseudomonadales bacterium]|nr:transporter substrate-binding domain-containing protein [Pseudomonadales bacterium]
MKATHAKNSPAVIKRYCWSGLVSWLLLLLPVYCLSCDDNVAVLSGATHYPPLTWRYQGKLVGLSVELVTKIFQELDVSTRTDQGGPWKRVLHNAKVGQVDVLMAVRKTPARETFLRFVEPPITPAVQGVFVLTGSQLEFEHWRDLVDVLGGRTAGASFGAEFDRYMRANLKIEHAKSAEHNFKKLLKGRIDYMLGPLMTTRLFIMNAELTGLIASSDNPLVIINEYIAFSKKSSCVQHKVYFERRLGEMINNGTMDRMLEGAFEQWFEQADDKLTVLD